VKRALQNTQSGCHQWLSHSFRVHQIRFRPGIRPGPRWGSLQHSPDLLVGLRGTLLLRRRGGKGAGRERGFPPNANSWIYPCIRSHSGSTWTARPHWIWTWSTGLKSVSGSASLAFGGTGLCSYRVRGVVGSCAKHLTVESYTVVMLLTFILIISSIPSPPHSFIPGLKPSFSAKPSHRSLPFLLQDWLRGFPGLFTNTSEHIRFLVFLFFHFLAVGSVWLIKLTHVSFWLHFKIASHISLSRS